MDKRTQEGVRQRSEQFANLALNVALSRAEKLEAVLRRYVAAYPAFSMKPIGAPNSPARIEQERLMSLEADATALLEALK